ncbi:MAG: CDP-glucose 4,6-dehydratase [Nanoarchaeota archaeon]|nr:CDP-glucose 4,6-dehydratase [Nanoarchaeota archaeon]
MTDNEMMEKVFSLHKPRYVFHLAAQPLVRLSYDMPKETFQTNILGTVNVLECIKETPSVKIGVMVTSDKCYKNKETLKGYTEEDELGGEDPYSSSKACAEIVINAYRQSFLNGMKKFVASARAGNVIGGGDFAKDRLIPDCINALRKNELINIRNPDATRPWQHVLESGLGYLLLGEKLFEGEEKFADAWNFGPNQNSMVNVKKVVDALIETWGSGEWKDISNKEYIKKEAKNLFLDNTKTKNILNWHPKWSVYDAIKKTVYWYKRSEKEDVYKLCLEQTNEFSKR